jgi:predicted ester cyclase
MPSEQNKSIVRRYLEDVWGRGQFGALRELVSQDVVDHDPVPGQPCGLEGQDWAARAFLGSLSNVKMTVEHLVADGDRVVDDWTFTATQTGDLFGMPATGRQFTITGTDESRIAGGKIVELWHREDMLRMMQELGFAPASSLPQSFGRPHTSTHRASGANGSTPSEQAMKDLMRQAFRQLIDRGDPASIDTFIAPDYVGHFSAFPTVYGRDGFREFVSIYTTGLSNRHTDIEDILIDGDTVAARVTYRGKNTGSMLGMPATGKTVAIKALMVLRMAGEQAAEQWANNDDLGMMQQLGVMPETAAAAPVPC